MTNKANKPMKVTVQIGNTGSPSHNSRNFNIISASHIDESRSHLNHYISTYPDLKYNFVETEKRFYRVNFSDWLKDINAKAIKQYHPERKKTSEDLRKGRNTKPQEVIYQIGNKDIAPTSTEFRIWNNELIKYQSKLTKENLFILDGAIHNDEATPHAHIRQVWVYHDKNEDGKELLKIGKRKAMIELGLPLPNPEKPEGQYNNRLMTYTRLIREEGERLAIEMGFNIDVEHSKRPHMSKEAYIRYITSREYENKVLKQIEQNQKFNQQDR
ncbi:MULTISPECIES: hypothetical protein [Streptococcus]|uniref:Mobilization protein n=1 Tax=Streptococcus macedonicus TaxID=59310 RepID=A0A2G3NSD8_STRMC|nr:MULTISPECIES: hypothetical protein [Streptococcus]PHV56470.1 hypothetical protein CS010_07845 [Streptococcus macedonicus]